MVVLYRKISYTNTQKGFFFSQIALGVKPGEPLSPLLFNIFVNDLYSDLIVADGLGEVDGVSINQICFFLLLFVDDMVLFSKDPMELQYLLDKLYAYSTKWGLKLNLTFVVIQHVSRLTCSEILVVFSLNETRQRPYSTAACFHDVLHCSLP